MINPTIANEVKTAKMIWPLFSWATTVLLLRFDISMPLAKIERQK